MLVLTKNNNILHSVNTTKPMQLRSLLYNKPFFICLNNPNTTKKSRIDRSLFFYSLLSKVNTNLTVPYIQKDKQLQINLGYMEIYRQHLNSETQQRKDNPKRNHAVK